MSYKEGSNPIYSYSQEEKQEIRKELGLTENSIQDDIDAILDWFEKQPHLIDAGLPDRDFIERMLIFAKGSREKTKRRIDNFFRYRSLAPELIQNREKHIEVHASSDFYRHSTISKLYDLKRITVLQFHDPDPNNFSLDVVLRCSILLGDLRLKYDYTLGDIWVIDLKGTGFGHLLRINLTVAQKATQIFQDGLGVRIYAIHLIGAPSYAQQIVNLFKRFAKAKITDRVIFHTSLDDLYKHIPKKYLPKDYGGEEPWMDEFKEMYLDIVRSDEGKQFLAECSRQISNEDKRVDALIHDEYLAGSFKKLELD